MKTGEQLKVAGIEKIQRRQWHSKAFALLSANIRTWTPNETWTSDAIRNVIAYQMGFDSAPHPNSWGALLAAAAKASARLPSGVNTTAATISPASPAKIDVDGRFLYGAPASGLTLDGEINISTSPDLKKQFEKQPAKKLVVDLTKVNLHLDPGQRYGNVLKGTELRKKLEGKPVLNAVVLDHYLANPHLIPEEWKGKAVFFWGTIYRHSDGNLYVRYLFWNGPGWISVHFWLGHVWNDSNPAAVSAS